MLLLGGTKNNNKFLAGWIFAPIEPIDGRRNVKGFCKKGDIWSFQVYLMT